MVQDINTIWPKALEELKRRVTDEQFRTWFSRLEPEGQLGTKVEVRVPGPIYRGWLARRYKPLLEEVLSSVSNESIHVAFTLGKVPTNSQSAGDGSVGKVTPPRVYLNNKFTFDNFVVGNCNRLAHAAALSVVSSPGSTYNPLFICGAHGLGKSHLLQAIFFALCSKGIKALYLPCESFIAHFIAALRNHEVENFRRNYRELDALLLDDMEQISKSPAAREELFHTFNALFSKQRQMVFAAAHRPDSLTGVEERLVSRFGWGLIARLEPTDFETRAAAVARLASSLNLPLSEEVALFLAENVPTNMRELERIMSFLVSLYPPGSYPPSLPKVKEALHGLLPAKDRTVHIEEILEVVASFFRLPQRKMQSKSRARAIVLPRQVAMYMARRFTTLSLEEIGGFLGGKDHSTVVHAERRISMLKSKNQDINEAINHIETRLLEGC